MILSFTAINKDANLRNFSCMIDGLEVALDVLTTITSFGDTILDARVVDGDSAIQLPCEVFDGQSMSVHIQQLELEWKAILDVPIPLAQQGDAEEGALLTMTRRRIQLYEIRLSHLNLTSQLFEDLIRQTEVRFSEGVQKDKLLNHYRLSLSKHLRFVQRNKREYETLLKRLSQLVAE